MKKRPKIMNERIELRITSELRELLETTAARDRWSVSRVIRRACREYVKKRR